MKRIVFVLGILFLSIFVGCGKQELPDSIVVEGASYDDMFSKHPEREFKDNELGTFMYIDDNNVFNYVVFNKEGEAWKYIQGDMQFTGEYSNSEGILTLSNKKETIMAVYANYEVYLFDSTSNCLYRYKKISDIPTFINVK